MTELERASAFEDALRNQMVDEVIPFPWGDALLTPSLPQVRDLNFLRVGKGAHSADELAVEAERIQGEAGLAHRGVAADSEELVEGFEALGWETECFVFMAYRGNPAREASAPVEEVRRNCLLPIREALTREAPWGEDDETVAQIIEAQARGAQAGRARHFAVRVDGEVVSAADLLSDGRTAQVEDVITLGRHRNRGYASAVVLRAVEEALAGGHDFVFLIADAKDWPKELYARLGFEPIGREWTFQKRVPASSVAQGP